MIRTSKLRDLDNLKLNSMVVKNCGIDKLIEIRSFQIEGYMYEVHVDATEERSVMDVFPESWEHATDEVYKAIDKAVSEINV